MTTYGRLDIYWPDGRFESHMLNDPSVSIGRSTGSTIVLDTDTISRYHVSITNDGEQVKISDMDSVNGTYIDGVRLPENSSQVLHGGEELQIGHLRMIYHVATDQPTMPISDISDDTQQRIESKSLGFYIEVYGPEIAVPPGSHTSIELTVTNNTEQPKRYTVKITGIPDGWARINRPELVVDAEENSPVLINLKPHRRSDSKPGEYPAVITVALKDDPEKKIEANVIFRVLPYTGFGMALATKHITSYESFKLHVHNQGSIDLPIVVMGRSADDELGFAIRNPQVMLGPGERQVIQGDVRAAKRRFFGKEQELPFDLLVRSRDEAAFLAAIRGYLISTPVFPRWAAGAMAFAGLALIGLLAFALLLILSASPAEPQILSFQASAGIITQGDSLTVSWTAQDHESANIYVNDTLLIEDISAEATSTTLITDSYIGETTIQLQVVNGDEADTQTIVVNVLQRLSIEVFEIEPPTLVRNVVQDVTVRWQVDGATLTQVDGLQSLLGAGEITTGSQAQGSIDVSGVPTENFSITLLAQDDDGNAIQETLNIDLINPECTVIEEALPLYDAPAIDANELSVAGRDQVLVVDRRDESGAWLRTQLPGGISGWAARTGLACADTFNPDALRIEITQETPESSS